MDFVALIIFLGLYYIRPQEWFSALNSLHPVQLLSIMAIWAMIQGRKLKPRELVVTPLDWLMLTYFIWTLMAGWSFMQTLTNNEAVLLFYFVAVRSLDSIRRLKIFLGWWCAFMLMIAALAIASDYGFDPLHSHDMSSDMMKGRLILNLSVFDNPNSLAHSVVPVVPLVYYLVFWRRSFMKVGLILMVIPLWCIYLTQSKGGFICCFGTVLATLVFGRNRIWQVVVVLLAIGFGYGAMFALPRMNELNHSKTDPAIQGRVAALQFGLLCMRTHFMGIGLGNFEGTFYHDGPLQKNVEYRSLPPKYVAAGPNAPAHEVDGRSYRVTTYSHYWKATHNAYNQNGAELGYVGLYLFVGILYCCIRTLLLVKSHDNDEECIRRALFATVVAYAISCWMVDFCYRPTFFMFVAAISAFHRLLLKKQDQEVKTLEAEPVVAGPPWLRRLRPFAIPGIALPGLPAAAPAGAASALASVPLESTATPIPTVRSRASSWKPKVSIEEKLRKKFIWNRLGILDFLIILLLTYAVIKYWEHLIVSM